MRRSAVRPIFGIHPGLILAVLDVIGLAIASYLASVELAGGVPVCGPIHGCEEVARSEYSRIAGVPVAVFGVVLSLVLLTLAIAWWRTNLHALLLAHYGLSLAGVPLRGVLPVRPDRGHRCRVHLVRELRPDTDPPLPHRAHGVAAEQSGGWGVPGELHVGLAADGLARPRCRDLLRPLPVHDPR